MRATAVFVQYPIEGKTRLRLAKFLGYEDASRLKKALISDNITIVSKGAYDTHIAYTLDEEKEIFAQLFPFPTLWQGEGDMGAKISAVATQLLKKYDRVALVASDIVNTDHTIIEQALDSLETDAHVAIAPSEDGGFGLIAMRKVHNIFQQMNWNKPDVFSIMKQRIHDENLTLVTMPRFDDLDTIEELNRVRTKLDITKYVRTNKTMLTIGKEW